jgi:hypothetical protein
LPAEQIADIYWYHGEQEIKTGWPYVTHADIAVCCWWVVEWRPRKWKKRWGDWAERAYGELWHGRGMKVELPPREVLP